MVICCCRNFEKSSFNWELKGSVFFLIVESYWRATNPPTTPTISSNALNQNFEIAILFNIVERSENYVFEDCNPPTALRARVVSCAIRAYKVYIERLVTKFLEGAHWIANQKF